MNTHTLKTIFFAVAGLLAAALPINTLFAQQTGASSVLIDGVRYVPVTRPAALVGAPATVATPVVVAPAGHESAANPSEPFQTYAPYFCVEASASYIKDPLKLGTDLEDTESDSLNNLVGAGMAFGWRINKLVKFQLETGIYKSSVTTAPAFNEEEDWAASGGTTKLTVTPLLASCSFYIPLERSGRCEIRITPTAGLYKMKIKGSNPDVYYGEDLIFEADSASVSGNPVAFGASVGFTYHFSKKFYADAGFRYLYRGKVTNTDEDTGEKFTILKSAGTSAFSIAVGYKF